MRPSSPLLDSVRDQFEDYDQIAKDFTKMFLNNEANTLQNAQLFDVVFMVGQSKQKVKLVGVRAILGVRSRVFQEMLYGIQTGKCKCYLFPLRSLRRANITVEVKCCS